MIDEGNKLYYLTDFDNLIITHPHRIVRLLDNCLEIIFMNRKSIKYRYVLRIEDWIVLNDKCKKIDLLESKNTKLDADRPLKYGIIESQFRLIERYLQKTNDYYSSHELKPHILRDYSPVCDNSRGCFVCSLSKPSIYKECVGVQSKISISHKRNYGFVPINTYFRKACAHHLHLENNNSFVMWIPIWHHDVVPHKPSKLYGMDTINAIALDYWIHEDVYEW